MRIAVVGESSRPANHLMQRLQQRGFQVKQFSPERNCRSLAGFKADRVLILRDHCNHSVIDVVRAANKRAEVLYLNVTSKSGIEKMLENF